MTKKQQRQIEFEQALKELEIELPMLVQILDNIERGIVILSSRLNRRAITLLLQDAIPNRNNHYKPISLRIISLVLDYLPQVRQYLKELG